MEPQPLPKSSGIRTVLIGSAIALTAIGFGVFSYTMLRPTPEESSVTMATSPTEAAANGVNVVGRLEPEGGVVKITVPAARVAKLLVSEGVPVQANQPLALMEQGETLYAALMRAEAQVKAAEIRLAQMQAGARSAAISDRRATILRASADISKAEAALLTATTELRDAQLEYDRYNNLFKNGAIASLDLQNRQVALEAKTEQQNQIRQALNQAKLTLEQAKQNASVAEVRPADIRQAQAQVDAAVATFRKAQADLEKAIVKAPIDGQVLKVHAKPGEVVGSNGVMELGNTKQMSAVVEVDETYLGRVKLGQRAKITSEVFPREITGTVAKVGLKSPENASFISTNTRVVEVKIRLDDSQSAARFTGLRVKVAIAP